MLFPSARTGLIAAGAAATLVLLTGCGGGDATRTPGPDAPITSTTRIASAGVLGNQRKPDESCAAEPAATGPGAVEAVRPVRNAAPQDATAPGVPAVTEVRGDPQRLVALAPGQLDALCALGLQGRVVGTAVPQPSYLGTVLHNAPPIADIQAARGANPDLILASAGHGLEGFGALSAIAPTVFTGPAQDWQATLRTVAAASGRSGAADAILGDFRRMAEEAGRGNDATHFQASIVQFTENTVRVYGTANFPASVLAEVGVDRPAAQRFTDRPYIEIDISDLSDDTDLSAADGDIVYLSFDSPAAKDHAPRVLDSAAWRKLSANRDDRVFAVNNEVWQTGQGVVAARGIIDDLRWLNAPIN
ncbi:MAG: iron-siderophore ABC transporter substrate-binding protein [Mycolicibacterium neoaurum]|uniref:iron-siderophore ABC transporter substrate-binding protein n=1 Tax=Mycolicibacterium neoaurum TaxID=1795 RepID=UPI002FF77E94